MTTTTTTTTPEPCLVLSDHHGIYIPQLWCSDITESECESLHVQWSDVQCCQSGPDHEWYWEAWQAITDACYMTDDRGITWRLWQDGDLWEVPDGYNSTEFFGEF
jgi:hypothetical protein